MDRIWTHVPTPSEGLPTPQTPTPTHPTPSPPHTHTRGVVAVDVAQCRRHGCGVRDARQQQRAQPQRVGGGGAVAAAQVAVHMYGVVVHAVHVVVRRLAAAEAQEEPPADPVCMWEVAGIGGLWV